MEGLTRENVASHLQKYRLQRGQGMGIALGGPVAGATSGGGAGHKEGDGATSAVTAGARNNAASPWDQPPQER